MTTDQLHSKSENDKENSSIVLNSQSKSSTSQNDKKLIKNAISNLLSVGAPILIIILIFGSFLLIENMIPVVEEEKNPKYQIKWQIKPDLWLGLNYNKIIDHSQYSNPNTNILTEYNNFSLREKEKTPLEINELTTEKPQNYKIKWAFNEPTLENVLTKKEWTEATQIILHPNFLVEKIHILMLNNRFNLFLAFNISFTTGTIFLEHSLPYETDDQPVIYSFEVGLYTESNENRKHWNNAFWGQITTWSEMQNE
ncbi:MAG: hypothetical protein ACXAC7_08760, partial [Candidatus Hodarchaeales archaeon]